MTSIVGSMSPNVITEASGTGTGWLNRCPGAMSGCAADRAVVVSTTDASALRDAQHTVMELGRFPNGTLHLVVNRVRRKLLKALSSNIDDAIDAAGLPLLGVIPEDPDVPYCLNRGLVLREQNYYAARAYENIAKRIMGQKTPLMKI